MNYTVENLFEFMDSERVIKVTEKSGKKSKGKCWAYTGIGDGEVPYLDIGPGIIVKLTDIEKIEYAD